MHARASGTKKWKRGREQEEECAGGKKKERERKRAVSFFVYAAVVLPVVDPIPGRFRTFGRFFSRPFYLSRYYYSHPALRRLRIPRSPRFRRCGRRAGNPFDPFHRSERKYLLPPEDVSILGFRSYGIEIAKMYCESD